MRDISVNFWNILVIGLSAYGILVGCFKTFYLCLLLNTFANLHQFWLVNKLSLNHFWKTFHHFVFLKAILLELTVDMYHLYLMNYKFIICAISNSPIWFWNNTDWVCRLRIRNRLYFSIQNGMPLVFMNFGCELVLCFL